MSRFLKPRHLSAILTLSTLLAIGASAPKFVHPHDVDYVTLLGPPPADGSSEQRAELATLHTWQSKRTPKEISRVKTEASANYFVFSSVLGSWFNEKSLPVTNAVFKQATIDLNSVSETAKAHYKRPRPYVSDPSLQPVVKPERSASYPSGHAVRGIVWATLLSEMFPEHKDALMNLGKQYGDDRIIAGMHYPSDVAAGQKLGEVIAKKLLENSDFKVQLERAKDECLAATH